MEEFFFFSFEMKWTITESKIILMISQQIIVRIIQRAFQSPDDGIKMVKIPIISRMLRVRRDVTMAIRFLCVVPNSSTTIIAKVIRVDMTKAAMPIS